ncbi:MAG: gluconokinase [Cyclobacteriaceae bacterium]|nr:gluconokinase [Cyclobacteriaceae bacterium]
MKQIVIAIDIGTTSTKALGVLSTGVVLAQHQVFYPTHYPRPGYAEQDATEILNAVITSLQAVATQIHLTNVKAICFSSAMHSLVAVDALGNALTPLITWADTRSSTQAKELKSTSVALQLHHETGTPVHPMSPLCKLIWLRERAREIFNTAHKFISIKEFVWFHLTGEFKVDYSIASATGLFDIHRLTWSNRALAIAGITTGQLSEVVPATYTYQSSISLPVLKDWHPIPVVIGASDGCLAQLGSNAMQPGVLTITLGTSGAVRRSATRQLYDPAGRLFNYLLLGDETVAGGATNNGTAVMDWFIRELIEPGTSLQQTISNVCTHVQAGSNGLLALPFLQGERAPIYNPDARGVFFYIGMQHTRHHFARALLEAICYELKWITASVESVCGPSSKIVVSGGITHFPEWIQMLANVLNRELLVRADHDASAIGAARLVFQSEGIAFQDEGLKSNHFKPELAQAQIYDEGYIRFIKLYQAVQSLF